MVTDPTPYDVTIAEAMRRYLPLWDWRWLKAQLYQESALNPDARNARSGAAGIAQFMPATWDDMLASVPGIPPHATPYDARHAIAAAAFYMSKLRRWWTAERPEDDRRRLALASYNCGFGNLVRAQKLAGGANDYAAIIERLPEITGKANAHETRTYVERIERYYNQLANAEGGSP